MKANHTAALVYRHQGWCPIPCNGKRSLIKWEPYQSKLPTPDEITAWWHEWPDANVALVTGKVSGLTVIDLDGEKGQESFKPLNLPRTFTVKTPHGWHLYYRYTPKLRTGAGFLPGIDVRNDGGYVVAPPSTFDGLEYRHIGRESFVSLDDVPRALMERPAVSHPAPAPDNPGWVTEALRGAPDHERNHTATRLAGYFHSKGLPKDVVYAMLVPFAQRCTPPMDERELWATVQSVERYPSAGEAKANRWYGGIPV